MRLLLANMLYHFDFALADPEDNWYAGLRAYVDLSLPILGPLLIAFSFMVWEKGRLRVKWTPTQK